MISLHRLIHSRAARNVSASYSAFISTSICALISIPIAVDHLDKSQIGLWSMVQIVVGYLLWMDLGVGNATGRKIAGAIANRDQREISSWWTLSIGVLSVLGLGMFFIALGLSSLLPWLLDIPPGHTTDALWLFLGTAFIGALGMPLRAYPGLLLAQERFHWVPLVQTVTPWIQVTVFAFLLNQGLGVRAYFIALGISQATGWLVWLWQIHGTRESIPFRVDFSGWTRARFHELFSFSGSLAATGILGTMVNSIPAMLLTRLGGLALIPIYNFTGRGPTLLNTLTQRTTSAFYPNLQKLYVTDQKARFRAKFREVNQLSVWVSLAAAGAALAGNRAAICWLSKPEFFAGHWTNIWFACAVMTIPFVSGLINLLQYSGNMGKIGLFSLLELLFGVAFGWLLHNRFGMPGLAATFAALPLMAKGPYALLSGASKCGFKPLDLCGRSLLCLAISLALICLAGSWIATSQETLIPITLLGRNTTWPTLRELTSGIVLATFGVVMAAHQLRSIRRA